MIHNNLFRFYFLIFVQFFCVFGTAQPSTEKIKFTGSVYETITIKIHGKEYVTDRLPFEFVLKQEQIPTTIIIESSNYEYRSIYVPKYTKEDYKIAKQTGEPINRTYVVGVEKKQQSNNYNISSTTAVNNPENKRQQLKTLQLEIDMPPLATSMENLNQFVVIIANVNYRREEPVPYANNDGEIFKSYCIKTLGIPEKNIKYIADASLNDLKYNLNWLKQVMEAYAGEAKAIFYYAGHGIPDEAQKTAYLLPVDGYGSDVTTGYKVDELYATLGKLPSKSVTVFLDACFSGSKRDGGMLASARGVSIKAKKSNPIGNMVVFSAAQGDETAYPYKEQRHGMFTYYLLKKLQETKGEATLGEISDYVTSEVRKQSIVINGKMQTPTLTSSSAVGDAWRNWKLK